MSTVTYRFENNLSTKTKSGVKTSVKQNIIDGEKGLSFTFLLKEGEKNFYRVSAKEVEKGKFEVSEKIGEEVKKTEMTMAELTKFIKSKKDQLEFVEQYIKNDRANYHVGGAKKAKKAKKASKKSKKTSKKVSKKKGSRNTKKTSKKAKKGSRKTKK